jgi:hypothetical protein
MDFGGIETHPIFSKNFDGLRWELTNQNIFRIKIYVKKRNMSLKNGNQKIQICVVERNKL